MSVSEENFNNKTKWEFKFFLHKKSMLVTLLYCNSYYCTLKTKPILSTAIIKQTDAWMLTDWFF